MGPRPQHGAFVPQPRQRELTYWLSDEAARYATDSLSTALRSMAGNRGQYRGLAGATLGAGVSFTGLGVLGWATGGGPGLLVGLSGAGLTLVMLGVLMFRRLRQRRLPKVVEMAPSRGPGNFKSGLGAGAFFTAVFAVISLPLDVMLVERGARKAVPC